MPSVKLSPAFNGQTFTSSGAPAFGYKVYTYAASSSSPLATYTDASGAVAQTNPVVLNAQGYPANPIWLQAGLSYKLVLTDSNDAVIKTIDNITGINDSSSSTSQWLASGVSPTYIGAGSFSVEGDQTTEFHVGRRLQFTTAAGTVYGTIASSTYTTLTTVTVTMDSGMVLDAGLSVVNLIILRQDSLALPDVATLLEDFTGANQSLAGSGYQKLPGGLIIQWGQTTIGWGILGTIPFNITFPNDCLIGLASVSNAAAGYACSVGALSASSMGAYHNAGTNQVINWVAIGR